MTSTLQKLRQIFAEHEPSVLTDWDISKIKQHQEQEQLYPELTAETLIQVIEQNDKEYNAVGSTLDAEYLDSTNMLFKVEDINQSDLYRTLELRKQARHTELRPNAENSAPIPEPKVHIIHDKVIDDRGRITHTKWIQDQTTQSNMILDTVFDWTQAEFEQLNESLQDMVDDNTTPDYSYRNKRTMVCTQLKRKLSAARKEYRWRETKKAKAVWKQRVNASQQLKDTRQDIQRYQKRLLTIEKAEFDAYRKIRKAKRERFNTRALDNFVDYQQSELKAGRDPKFDREDVVAKYPYLNPLVIPEFTPTEWR